MTDRKALFVYNTARYLWRFRRELMEAFQARGFRVLACVPLSDPDCAKLRSIGVECIDLPIHDQRVSPVADLKLFLYLRRLLARLRPDAVFLFTLKPVLFGSIAARLTGVRGTFSMIAGLGYVFSRGGFRHRILQKLLLAGLRFGLRGNAAVFFQNEEDMAMFIERGCVRPERAVRIFGSGVDLDAFSPRSERQSHGVFLLLSRLLEEKGVAEFAEAARRLGERFPAAEFWIAGPLDPGPAGLSRDAIRAWEESGAVRYLGAVEDVPALLHKADVFVLPTYYREGVPRTVLEALACGLPVITTDTPGCRDTVIEGENGFLVPPRDAGALAESMLAFLDEPGLAAAMGARSRQLAIERFDVRRVTGRIMAEVGKTVEVDGGREEVPSAE